MKQSRLYFLTALLLLAFVSCQDDEGLSTITNELKGVIRKEHVTTLQYCCVGCSCYQGMGWGDDYEFLEDNMLRIRQSFYNLLTLRKYEVTDVEENDVKERRMVLYFEE